jgi:membrane protease YdiL (CAAX protease family)
VVIVCVVTPALPFIISRATDPQPQLSFALTQEAEVEQGLPSLAMVEMAVTEELPGWQVRIEETAGTIALYLQGPPGGAGDDLDRSRLTSVVAEHGLELRETTGELLEPGLVSMLLVMQAAIFIAAGLALRSLRCRQELPEKATLSEQIMSGALFGGVALAGSMALSVVLTMLGQHPQEQAWVIGQAHQRGPGMALFVLLAVVVVPIGEEILFRGYAFERLRQRGGIVAAYLVSSLLFAATHANPSALVIYFYLGLVLAHAYQRTGTVVAPIIAHGVNNLLAFGLLLLSRTA